MNKRRFFIMVIVVLIVAVSSVFCYKYFAVKNETDSANNEVVQKSALDETTADADIVEISVDAVEGITPVEAEELCYNVLGEKDEETGFTFSFGTAAAVEKGGKQYYVIRASWLVNNSHLSYIGDFFVSADGKEIYDGTARPDEYIMQKLIWRK